MPPMPRSSLVMAENNASLSSFTVRDFTSGEVLNNFTIY